MKHSKHFVATLVLAALIQLSSQHVLAQAQPAGNYFLGEWNALLMGLPEGDMPFVISFSMEKDSLQASMYDEARTFIMPVEKITRNGESAVTLSFYDYNNGVDVIINLSKKDEDNITGNVLNMYSITATRKN